MVDAHPRTVRAEYAGGIHDRDRRTRLLRVPGRRAPCRPWHSVRTNHRARPEVTPACMRPPPRSNTATLDTTTAGIPCATAVSSTVRVPPTLIAMARSASRSARETCAAECTTPVQPSIAAITASRSVTSPTTVSNPIPRSAGTRAGLRDPNEQSDLVRCAGQRRDRVRADEPGAACDQDRQGCRVGTLSCADPRRRADDALPTGCSLPASCDGRPPVKRVDRGGLVASSASTRESWCSEPERLRGPVPPSGRSPMVAARRGVRRGLSAAEPVCAQGCRHESPSAAVVAAGLTPINHR